METVQTKLGAVRGQYEDGMWVYRGIPFAEAPTGNLRFKPPVSVKPWSGILDALRDGVRPWQTPAPWATDASSHSYGENCLNLNIWTPETDGKKRPVLVLIFGGGHFEGSNCEIGMVAQPLLKDQEIVMVAPNYRVGPLGYLYLAHLLGDEYAASGNLGLLDQIEALRWVRDNIEAFGGDPDQITVMGQSAGGKSVASLLASPLSHGLFHRCIMMSGALQCIKNVETEKALTRNYLHALGLNETNAGLLLTMSPERIRYGQEKANEVYFKAESYGATADGTVIPKNFCDALLQRRIDGVEILMGHAKQELFLQPGSDKTPLSDEAMAAKMRWKFGDNASRVMNIYRERLAQGGFEHAYGSVVTEYTYVQQYMRSASVFAAAGAKVFLYRWDAPGAPVASHTSDLETVFDRRNDIEPAAAMRLKNMLRGFIRSGSPQLPDMPNWETVQENRMPQMLLGKEAVLRMISEEELDSEFPLQVMKLKY